MLSIRVQAYEEIRKPRNLKEKTADLIANVVGSWAFLITQTTLITLWVIVNACWANRWDPYPFILLNLTLSFQAAYTAPIIMMNQNRHAAIDRVEAHLDYRTNQNTEEDARAILDLVKRQVAEIEELKKLFIKHTGNGKG